MLTFILIYLAVALAVPLWDAFIGFGFEFPDIRDGPNAVLAGVFWPIGIPIILMICFSTFLERAKKSRLNRQAQREKVRIAQEKMRIAQEAEVEAAMRQVEEELDHVQTKGKNKR